MKYSSRNFLRQTIILVSAFLAFPNNSHGLKITIIPEQYVTPSKFAILYNSKKFDSLSGLFLYPQSQPSKSRTNDSAMFASIFRSMHEQWGGITSYGKSSGLNRWNVAARFSAGDSISIREFPKFCTDTTYISVEYENRNQFILRFIQCRQENRHLIGFLDFARNISVNPQQAIKDETNFQKQLNRVLNDAGQGDMK